jgi:hypothetical protein
MASAAPDICFRKLRLEFIGIQRAKWPRASCSVGIRLALPARKRRVAKTGPAAILKTRLQNRVTIDIQY